MPEKRRNPLSMSDEPMEPTGATDEDEIKAARAANRFDIRRIIGGLFILYSLILIALGIFGSAHVKNKASGINVDLWTGLGMLVFGALMVFWALSRPTAPEPSETRGEGSGRIRRAPAT
jgi:hypothetical protein